MLETVLTVRDLRRRWKPQKERLAGHPTAIRFHRACSWLDRAEKLDQAEDLDLVLINQWIALNALYGQWSHMRNEPEEDRNGWRGFFDRLLRLDQSRHLSDVLTEHRPLVLSLLEDEYLAGFYWKEPTEQNKYSARNQKKKALGWYFEKNWTMVLDRLIERIYLLRCQLIHGAATYGGKLNRTALRRSTQMLGRLMPAVLLVIIDHGADEDWGSLCYPPMESRFVPSAKVLEFIKNDAK
jgi:hypothetical protein